MIFIAVNRRSTVTAAYIADEYGQREQYATDVIAGTNAKSAIDRL